MRSPSHPRLICCVFALGVCQVRSAGVAALKEQSYHRDLSARAVPYSRIIDSHGPYLRIVSGSNNVDILRSKMVARIEVADGIPSEIMEEEDISPLRETLKDLRKFSARYPGSAGLLKPQIAALTTHVRHFDLGQIRFEGSWMSRTELAELTEARRRDFQAKELAEIEKRAFDGAQRDQGLVLHDGRWMTPQEIERVPANSRTELSEAIEPLWSGDLEGARFSVKNLTDLATRQTGAPKVRTERLLTVIRNLFVAEEKLTRRIMTSTLEDHQASIQDKNAKDWLKPNGFGTVTYDASRESQAKAAKIRRRSAEGLEQCKQNLRDQLGETETLAADFSKLREKQVTATLGAAVRAVSSRHFTEAEFQPTSSQR
jgi:hypothetical protein